MTQSFKKHFIVLGAMVMASALVVSSAWAEPIASAEQVQGEVYVHTAGSAADAWQAITASTALSSGDSLKTKAGSCQLTYKDQATFAVDANTEIMVTDQPQSQQIDLILGSLKGKVNHDKVTKEFHVATPTAVAAVRGTDVNFAYNNEGKLTVDLNDGGPVQVVNDTAGLNIDLDTKEGKKTITIAYDEKTGTLTIKNNCDSHGNVICSVLGKEFSVIPCGEETITPETATGGDTPPVPPTSDDPNPPNENTPPSSETGEIS